MAPLEPIEPDLELGAFKFQTECAHCHGDDGKGTQWGPQVLGLPADFAAFVIRVGRDDIDLYFDAMPAYLDRLTRLEIESIAAWIASAPTPAAPEELFVQFCGNCHGLRLPPIATAEFAPFLAQVRAGRVPDAPEQQQAYMPAWSPEALSDDAVRRIFDWVWRAR